MAGNDSRARGSSLPEAVRNRHGRGMRSPVTGPKLPRLRSRIGDFESTISMTVDYLQGLWPKELEGLRIEVADLPPASSTAISGSARVSRWLTVPEQRKVIFYRLPIERLSRLHRNDEFHRRMLAEGMVFQAIAELLGKDPWDLAPERFRFH
ncbi:MAG: metallopeptidase family protein [Cryobacterium sp.]|nr:metallopeptidase family protein [Cryobacterium sp.]MCO5294598.1 metallopeptidase family protein [Homoserinimonas sp.]MCW5945145.1 metallopeptidase family protein [Cryobacterium sp.]